jgi:hypothetical protein
MLIKYKLQDLYVKNATFKKYLNLGGEMLDIFWSRMVNNLNLIYLILESVILKKKIGWLTIGF